MKKTLSLFTFIFALTSLKAFAIFPIDQDYRVTDSEIYKINDNETLSNKYWKIRTRNLFQLVRVGEGAGRSMVASDQDPSAIGRYSLKWGDGLVNHGWYIATLATEWALLNQNGLDTSGTLSELYYAIKAINRLDKYAETYYLTPDHFVGYASTNGFLIRNDIPAKFVNLFSYPIEIQSVMDARNENVNNWEIEISQDQIIHLMLGLKMVERFIPSDLNYKEINFNSEVKKIALRIGKFFDKNGWEIINPVTNKAVARGDNARFLSYGIYKQIESIVGKDAAKELHPKFYSYLFIKSPFARSGLIPKFYNRALAMILDTVGNIWGTSLTTIMRYNSWKWEKGIWNNSSSLVLAKAILNDTKKLPSKFKKEYSFEKLNEELINYAHDKIHNIKDPDYVHNGHTYLFLSNIVHLFYKSSISYPILPMPEEYKSELDRQINTPN